jgi:hypothetical protein
MEVPRTARKPVEVDVDAVLPSGVAATLEGVEFALCTHDGPTAVTVGSGHEGRRHCPGRPGVGRQEWGAGRRGGQAPRGVVGAAGERVRYRRRVYRHY